MGPQILDGIAGGVEVDILRAVYPYLTLVDDFFFGPSSSMVFVVSWSFILCACGLICSEFSTRFCVELARGLLLLVVKILISQTGASLGYPFSGQVLLGQTTDISTWRKDVVVCEVVLFLALFGGFY